MMMLNVFFKMLLRPFFFLKGNDIMGFAGKSYFFEKSFTCKMLALDVKLILQSF